MYLPAGTKVLGGIRHDYEITEGSGGGAGASGGPWNGRLGGTGGAGGAGISVTADIIEFTGIANLSQPTISHMKELSL